MRLFRNNDGRGPGDVREPKTCVRCLREFYGLAHCVPQPVCMWVFHSLGKTYRHLTVARLLHSQMFTAELLPSISTLRRESSIRRLAYTSTSSSSIAEGEWRPRPLMHQRRHCSIVGYYTGAQALRFQLQLSSTFV